MKQQREAVGATLADIAQAGLRLQGIVYAHDLAFVTADYKHPLKHTDKRKIGPLFFPASDTNERVQDIRFEESL